MFREEFESIEQTGIDYWILHPVCLCRTPWWKRLLRCLAWWR